MVSSMFELGDVAVGCEQSQHRSSSLRSHGASALAITKFNVISMKKFVMKLRYACTST